MFSVHFNVSGDWFLCGFLLTQIEMCRVTCFCVISFDVHCSLPGELFLCGFLLTYILMCQVTSFVERPVDLVTL